MTAGDVHSYSNPHEVRVCHLDLELTIKFSERVLRGAVGLTLERVLPGVDTLVLDTRDLVILGVESGAPGAVATVDCCLGEPDPILGAPLSIRLPADASTVRIRYETRPQSSALQWLTPSQTAGKRHPFMFTQSQAIHARSWIPLQDSPGVRVTYTARVTTPPGLRAVMGAAHDPDVAPDDVPTFRFRMPQPIPSYLIALAVGELAFEPLGTRAGVYAEPSVLEAATREFDDIEAMIAATEGVYGAYQWGRYDVLVLPPSFPFGGMENPRLTFATPTILAGDKSLVSLIAHELAHSWSGNLVTNATWSDFWLNEGFTVYIERRIIEAVFGRARAEMESVLGRRRLASELEVLAPADTCLRIDLTGRDPDEGMTHVPYEKGALFLCRLEETVGRDRFDEFLLQYFETFAFRSISTQEFVSFLDRTLGTEETFVSADVDVDAWLTEPGLPLDAPEPRSERLSRCEAQGQQWLARSLPAADLAASRWTTQEWLHFFSTLPSDLSADRLAELDAATGVATTGNAEVAHAWLLLTITTGYRAADEQLERYLVENGRRKLIQPLYEALVSTPDGHARARAIYRTARPGYHPISVDTIDEVVGDVATPPPVRTCD